MFINTTTTRAGLRGVSRVNAFNQHTNEFGLIFNKLAQLAERPGVMLPPLVLTNRDPVTDALEVFKSYTATAVFDLCNNTLADYVINMGSKPLLFLCSLLHKSLGCLSSLRLKLGAKLGMALSETINLIPGEDLTIRVRSNINDTKINAEKLSNVTSRGFFYLANLMEVKLSIAINKVSLTSQRTKKIKLFLSGNKRHCSSTIHRPDRNSAFAQLPREDAFIVGNTAMPFESLWCFVVALIGIGDLSQHSHYHLSCKVKTTSNIIVKSTVKIILAKYACAPSVTTNVVSGVVYSLQRLEQRMMLLFGRLKLNLSNQFHNNIITGRSSLDKEGGSRIPLLPEEGSLLRQRL